MNHDHWRLLKEIIVSEQNSLTEQFHEAVLGLYLPDAFLMQVQAKVFQLSSREWAEGEPERQLCARVFVRNDFRKEVGELAWGFFLLERMKTETRHEIEAYLYADSYRSE